jgi:hypothetical protein
VSYADGCRIGAGCSSINYYAQSNDLVKHPPKNLVHTRTVEVKPLQSPSSHRQPTTTEDSNFELPSSPWIPECSQKAKSSNFDPMKILSNFKATDYESSFTDTPTEIWCPGPRRHECLDLYEKWGATAAKLEDPDW